MVKPLTNHGIEPGTGQMRVVPMLLGFVKSCMNWMRAGKHFPRQCRKPRSSIFIPTWLKAIASGLRTCKRR